MKKIHAIILLLSPAWLLAGQPVGGTGGSQQHRVRFGGPPPITFEALAVFNNTLNTTVYSNGVDIAFAPNKLVLVTVVSSLASWAKPTGIIAPGMTFTEVTSTNFNSAGGGISVWRAMTNATSPSGRVRVTFAGTQTGCNIRIVQFGNVDSTGANGANAVRQAAMATNAIANPTITLATLNPTGKSAVWMSVANVDANGNAGAAETDWVEDFDDGYGTPSTGLYTMYRLTTTDNTPTVTQGAQQWAAIAVEVTK